MVREQVKRHPAYSPPAVTYHGRVDELTLGDSLELGVHTFQMAAAFTTSVIATNQPNDPGTPVTPSDTGGNLPGSSSGGNVPGGSTSTPSAEGGLLPTGDSSGPSGEVTDAVGNGTSGGTTPIADVAGSDTAGVATTSGSGKLPFTGFAVVLVAGVGAAAASGGAVLRRYTGRRPS